MFRKKFTLLLCLLGLLSRSILATPLAQTDIDAAIATATAQGRIIQISAGSMAVPTALQQLTSLPVVFRNTVSGLPYDIVILNMAITPSGSMLTVACKFTIPQSAQALYFGAANVQVSGSNGFSGDMAILPTMLSPKTIDDPTGILGGEQNFYEVGLPLFQGKLNLGLGSKSKVSFRGGKLRGFNLMGYIKSSGQVIKEAIDSSAIVNLLLTIFSKYLHKGYY